MAKEEFQLNALGVYLLGYDLERLEWAIMTIKSPSELAPFFGELRLYEDVHPIKDIGREAKGFHNMLSRLGKEEVPEATKDILRNFRVRWHTLARERLQGLYLVTPSSKVDAKYIMQGIKGFLAEEDFDLLEQIEVSDLNEACRCILVGSSTAAEHITLRAAESLLRRWYEHKTSKRLSRGTWGYVLDKLVKEYPEEKSRPKEITLLGYLKQRRDEVAHPERVSSLTEAETTFMNVCSLIEGIKPVLVTVPSLPASETQLPIPDTEGKKKGANKG